MDSGIYSVTLKNEELISVNAPDRRRSEKSIKVNRGHCKFGKSKNLGTRKADYCKVFGEEHVIFTPLAALLEIGLVEAEVLKRLSDYRVLGSTGRKNEWLSRISPKEVVEVVFSTLQDLGIEYRSLISDSDIRALNSVG